MERLSRHNDTPRGLSTSALRTCGYLCLLFGVTAKGIIQNGLLDLGGKNTEELLMVMEQSSEAMSMITASIVLQIVEVCAVPIFAFLLVEGFQKTSNYKNYLTRMILGAVSSADPLLNNKTRIGLVETMYFKGSTYEDRCRTIRELIETTPEDLLKLADVLEETTKDHAVCVVAGQSLLDACGEQLGGIRQIL